MNSTSIKKISELNDLLPEEYVFICFSSFEERCKKIATSLDSKKIIKSYIIRNVDKYMEIRNKDNYLDLCNLLPNNSTIKIELNKPVEACSLFNELVSSLTVEEIKNVVIDITTFTHETLLFMIKYFSSKKDCFSNVLFIYNNATEYSDWLSKGCKEVRNVVGYPGTFKPSQKNHLILLTGFEKERATKLVELLEPDLVSLGNGMEPTNDKHSKTMREIKEAFDEWSKNLQGVKVSTFDFSCKDISSTIRILKEIIQSNCNENFILIPLNTKLSTVSVALVALENKRIQVCYPIPETYNLEYSKPGNMVTIFNYKDFTV